MTKLYRPNVGITIFNKEGRVLVCKWDTDNWTISNKRYCWQMPQGGIDSDETPLDAAYREIREEASIESTSLKFLKQSSGSCRYDFPKQKKQYIGQDQTWLAFEFLGNDSEIDVVNCSDPCFKEWRWEDLEKTLDLVVPFKRETYQFMLCEFKNLYLD